VSDNLRRRHSNVSYREVRHASVYLSDGRPSFSRRRREIRAAAALLRKTLLVFAHDVVRTEKEKSLRRRYVYLRRW
jgi:secreted Zn-dependent insulinase-like peptidase